MTKIIVFLHGNSEEGFDDSVLHGNGNYDFNDGTITSVMSMTIMTAMTTMKTTTIRGRLHGTLSSYADAPPRPVQLPLLTKMSNMNY